MKVIVVTNQKGGTGKSTLAVHAALYAAEAGRKVLFIDCDSQGSSTKVLDSLAQFHSKTVDMFSVDLAKVSISRQLNEGDKAMKGLCLFKGDENVLKIGEDEEEIFISNLEWFRREKLYDVCIIDTPPAPSVLQIAPLKVADFAVSPIEVHEFSVDGVGNMVTTIEGIRQHYNSKLVNLGIIPNRYKPSNAHQKAMLNDLQSGGYDDFLLGGKEYFVIGERQAIPEALSLRIPVWKIKKTAARVAAKEVRGVLKHIFSQAGVI